MGETLDYLEGRYYMFDAGSEQQGEEADYQKRLKTVRDFNFSPLTQSCVNRKLGSR